MSRSTILQRLQAEAAQQPGKAVVLVAGLLLGIYMWIPQSLFTGDGNAKNDDSAVASVPTIENMLNSFAKDGDAALGQSEGTRWYDRSRQLDTIDMFQPSKVTTGMAFGGGAVRDQQQQDQLSAIESSAAEKFLLRSILISKNGRFANLNSKIVREGDLVWVDFRESTIVPLSQPKDESTWTSVKVIRIDEDQVELQIGQSQPLTIRSGTRL